MFLTEVNAEANADGDTHGLIIQPQSASRNRPSVQPLSSIWTTCGQQACPVIRVCEAGLKNLEALVHRCLIPTSLFGSVWTQWLRAPLAARPSIQSTVQVGIGWTVNRQKLGLEILCCCCRGKKCRRCEQTNTTDSQATILNQEAGLNPIQVVNLDVRQTTQPHP